jgi:hypothetical protein
MIRFGLASSVALLLTSYVSPAMAQDPALAPAPVPAAAPAPMAPVQAASTGTMPTTGFTLWGGVGYFGLYGIGASYMMPVADGVLNHPTIRDRFELEFGATYLRRSYGYLTYGDYTWNEVVPVVGVAWMVWLKSNLAVYPKLDVGYAFGWLSGFDYCNGLAGCSNPSYGGVFVNGSVGVMYNIGSVVLRGEAGNELLKGGVGFLF